VALLAGIAAAGLFIGSSATSTGLSWAAGLLLALSAGLFVVSGRRPASQRSRFAD
jgi:hypothetical protein